MPSDDPGVFNLLINEDVLVTGGNGTSTGPHVVGVGEGTVSETAASPATNLSNYETTIDCTRNGVPVLSVEGTKVDGAVANGDEVVCTFTNRRSTTPPVVPPVVPARGASGGSRPWSLRWSRPWSLRWSRQCHRWSSSTWS